MISSLVSKDQTSWIWSHIQGFLKKHKHKQHHKCEGQKWNELPTHHDYHLHQDSKFIIQPDKLSQLGN